MRYLTILLLCSCVTTRKIQFSDDSESAKSWVCVKNDDGQHDWACVSTETFNLMLRKEQAKRSDM